MNYYIFLDESGDHGLKNIDPDFPIFVLCGVVLSQDHYDQLNTDFNEIKQHFWNTSKVIFHSRDIRKCDKEFKILLNYDVKSEFYQKLDHCIVSSNYSIISSIINKEKHVKKYGKLQTDVYEIALSFIKERAVFLLDSYDEEISEVQLIIEKRGKREDTQLKNHIENLFKRGTYYVKPERINSYGLKHQFVSKYENYNGLQLSDLNAYPIARYAMDKERANPAFDLIRPKIYSRGGKMYGLKTFP